MDAKTLVQTFVSYCINLNKFSITSLHLKSTSAPLLTFARNSCTFILWLSYLRTSVCPQLRGLIVAGFNPWHEAALPDYPLTGKHLGGWGGFEVLACEDHQGYEALMCVHPLKKHRWMLTDVHEADLLNICMYKSLFHLHRCINMQGGFRRVGRQARFQSSLMGSLRKEEVYTNRWWENRSAWKRHANDFSWRKEAERKDKNTAHLKMTVRSLSDASVGGGCQPTVKRKSSKQAASKRSERERSMLKRTPMEAVKRARS